MEEDSFIYKHIEPFCNNYAEGNIDKQTLIDALNMYNNKANYKKIIPATWKLHTDGTATCSNCKRTCGSCDYDNYDRYCRCCGATMSLSSN